MESAVTGEYTMAYFTDRCGKTCEVTRLMGHPMGLNMFEHRWYTKCLNITQLTWSWGQCVNGVETERAVSQR